VDKNFYPLGSCTMKYNPKLNEDMARLPALPTSTAARGNDGQGALAMMYQLQRWLAELSDEGRQPAPAAGRTANSRAS